MTTDLIKRLESAYKTSMPVGDLWNLCAEAADDLERLTAEHHNMRARLSRAVCAAEEHFGEDAIRYKLSLFANGRARNVFPQNVDGHWFALQRADNDAHIGLALRCMEAESERDNLRNELDQLNRDHDSQGGMLELVKQRRDELEAENEALRADAELLDWMQRQSLDDFAVGLVVDAPHDGEYWCSPDTGGMHYGKTLREAMKAARKG